jgi:hypothetical protein
MKQAGPPSLLRQPQQQASPPALLHLGSRTRHLLLLLLWLLQVLLLLRCRRGCRGVMRWRCCWCWLLQGYGAVAVRAGALTAACLPCGADHTCRRSVT